MSDQNVIIVWSEIPATDLERAVAFYNATFKWDMTIDESGPNPMADLGGTSEAVGGHLYPGKPGDGPTPHILVPDTLEATMERALAAGGKVESDPIPLPVGRFVYARDTEGNSIGFFEPRAA